MRIGVVIVATGHPYFAHLAATLAAGIKYQNPEIEICLVRKDESDSQLSDQQKALFTIIKEMPDKFITGRYGYDPYKFKLHLNDLSPFDKTIFLDADMIWSPQKYISDLFAEMDGRDVMFVSRKKINIGEGQLKSMWVDPDEVRSIYGLKEIYDISSEVMYFEKTEKSKKFFKDALKVYNDNKMNVKPFGDGKPDEVFLMVALGLNNIELQTPFTPTYWQPFYFNKIHSREFMQSHYAISVGGAYVIPQVKKVYDSIAVHYYNRMGIDRAPYQLIPKSRIMKERKKI